MFSQLLVKTIPELSRRSVWSQASNMIKIFTVNWFDQDIFPLIPLLNQAMFLLGLRAYFPNQQHYSF